MGLNVILFFYSTYFTDICQLDVVNGGKCTT